jgi:hypothetical protein
MKILALLLLFFPANLPATDYDPKTSVLTQNQQTFFFSPFSFQDLHSAGTVESIAWANASTYLIRTLFPAASADENRFYIQYSSLPERSVPPYPYVYFCCSINAPGPFQNPLQVFYSDTFHALRPNFIMGYSGRPLSRYGRLSAGFHLDIIRASEPYFGQYQAGYRYGGYWLEEQPLRLFTDGNSRLNTIIAPPGEPMSTRVTHNGWKPSLTLSWQFSNRWSAGTRLAWAGYRLDGRLADHRSYVQPNLVSMGGLEQHRRSYNHYDVSGGVKFTPVESSQIHLSAGFLTGTAELGIDYMNNQQISSISTGYGRRLWETDRNVYYLNAAANHQISRTVSASVLVSLQRGFGQLDDVAHNSSTTTYPLSGPEELRRSSSTTRIRADIETREIRAGFLLAWSGHRLHLYSGFWLSDHNENFDVDSRTNNTTIIRRVDEDGVRQTFFTGGFSHEYSDPYGVMRYEIPAGVRLTLFPWLDLDLAVAHTISRADNPRVTFRYTTDLPGIGNFGQANTVDPANYYSGSTEYKTHYVFGATLRPIGGLSLRASLQPVHNSMVESSWLGSFSVEVMF